MMDFSKMKMTHEQMEDSKYRIRVGNDIIEVQTYFDNYGYFRITTLDHYIKTLDNKPTNPYRTSALSIYVDEYLEKLYQSEVEEDLREIASFPVASCLKEDYNGHRLHFYAGATANQVIQKFEATHKVCITRSSDFYDIYMELSQMPDGFLSEEIKNLLTF